MLQNLCEFATDYQALLRTLNDPLKLREIECIVQFPFALPVVEEKTEEELVKIAERRKEQGRKLQELAARTRMDKVCLYKCPPQYSSLGAKCSLCKRRMTFCTFWISEKDGDKMERESGWHVITLWKLRSTHNDVEKIARRRIRRRWGIGRNHKEAYSRFKKSAEKGDGR